ncbi:AMIN-like domain-containing (lipo)protein [Actinocrinis sp.]|uniref:AMIN-like domain-containing (lipo)protein n=1 Tax=Actinocrinis sp. TaxID=1920516 RepID=UPI002C642001|nr:hypothetical protein [Actinocrinis sp.]HXR73162.1 hypothetical protein [Actinocrinis sp.]
MKRPLSPFEQELVNAMDEYAHRAVPPPFNATRIVARERQRVRVRLSIAAVCVATAAGIASCVATSVPGNGNKGLPVVGNTNTPVSVTASPTPGSSTASASPASSGGGAVGGKVSAGPAGTVPIWPTGATSSPFAGSVPPVPEVTSIRVGAHPEGGYDRISLEFTGQAPGFRAGYVAQVIRQGSGAPVSLPGAAFLQLTFSSAQAHDDNGNPTLNPSPTNPVSVSFPELRSYVLNGDFEGTVSVALGLAAQDGFHVSELTKSPTDHVIYVDIARAH